MAVRTNLITNPSFETDAAGWSPTPLRPSPGTSYSGSYWAYNQINSTSAKVPATAGLPYTGSGWFRGTFSTAGSTVSVHFYDASDVELSPPTITTVALAATNVWERRSSTRTAPAGTATVALRYTQNSSHGSYHADAFLLEQSSALGDYFDGSTVKAGYGYAWTGTAHASSSTETRVRTNQVKNPSFELDAAGWLAYDADSSINQSTAVAYTGTQSLGVLRTSLGLGRLTATYGTTNAGAATSYSIPVTAGQTVSVSMYVNMGTSVPLDVFPMIFWQSSTGAFLSSVAGTTVTTSGTWQRLTLTGTAPAGATTFGLGARVTSTGNNFFYIDAVLAEIWPSVESYFDGSSTGSGHTYAWTGTAHASTSTETANHVIGVHKGTSVPISQSTVTCNLPGAVVSGDVIMALVATNATNITNHTVSGLGATWTKVAEDSGYHALALWKGVGATANGTVTATLTSGGTEGDAGTSKAVGLWHLRGVTATTTAQALNATSDTLTSAYDSVAAGQVIIGVGYSTTAADAFKDPAPTDWVVNPVINIHNDLRYASMAHREGKATAENHRFSTYRLGSTAHPLLQVVVGDAAGGTPTLNTAVSTEATVTTALSTHRTLATPVEGEVTVSTALSPHHNLAVPVAVEATAGTVVVNGGAISVPVDADVTVSTALSAHHNLTVPATTEVTVNTSLVSDLPDAIAAPVGVSINVWTKLTTNPRITVPVSVEAVTFTELFYDLPPRPLTEGPLGKLVRYTVNNSAVPLNPAEGSGSTPSVNATYIKGRNPEFALGENFTVDNGAVGTYTGEIVRLSLNKKSDVASISTDTLLTLTNVDMHLFPFIDAAPSLWTAARAIDYWTQQCGLFYDKVDGDCAVYASGFGHPNGYAEGAGNSHFYTKLTAGTASTSVANDRSVASFGSEATSVMAQHEAPQTRVPVTVGGSRKMVFSLGLGIRGTGRTATASYRFLDGLDKLYTVDIEATSAGVVTAKVNGAEASSITVPAGGNYRVSFSFQRMSETALLVKLTAHEDDLAGNGDLLVNGQAKVISFAIPGTLWLTSLVHSSTGGTGVEMLRWGTYLAVADTHPMTLPRVQKTLGQSKQELGYVSGFTSNVWAMLNEFCSINRLDLSFADDRVVVGPRLNGFNGSVKFGDFDLTAERREKYRQVAVVNKQSKPVTTNTAVMWRADSVFQVAAREVFETTVQTGHSILTVANPVAVTGIWPFPYTAGAGQYVVTGADGYIIAPQWWADNGGKVEASLTEVDGEIAIKITAPSIDTVRAPYRISEGAGDRPALYISGAGIVNDPEELHINTGAKKAREGFDSVFESPFIATANDAFNVAARMAQAYSAAAAEVSFKVTNNFDAPSVLGTFPAGVVFTDNERNFKITDASQTHSQVSGSAVPFTTIAAYKASFPAGATIRDEKARHVGRTIKQTNIKPLRSNDESA